MSLAHRRIAFIVLLMTVLSLVPGRLVSATPQNRISSTASAPLPPAAPTAVPPPTQSVFPPTTFVPAPLQTNLYAPHSQVNVEPVPDTSSAPAVDPGCTTPGTGKRLLVHSENMPNEPLVTIAQAANYNVTVWTSAEWKIK